MKNPVLVKNALYQAGPLPTTTCDDLPAEPVTPTEARTYINEALRCLESTWGRHLKKAGLPYEPVKVRYVTSLPKNYCGSEDGETIESSEVWYCDWDRTLSFKIGKSWLLGPPDLDLFNTTAVMYGYHVQKLAGLYDASEDLRAGSKAEHLEQRRRMYQQVECLGAAFMKSVWPLPGKTARDWKRVESSYHGDTAEYGKAASIKQWVKAGFRTADPASCNTWVAPSSKVS
ncbi:similar to metalloprotease [[Actinomadura] parvosata subsp. kistnae]|uniref:hypothetical protein n=1 Tax=[Actinomadura] parvosata TaxID=1955412 RepID=UPI000D292BDA|nr:similar to metalloprotease [Actinomadura parvosata subsp. kistnae]